MIMTGGYIYDGDFSSETMNSKWAMLYLPQMIIYEGPVHLGQTSPVGMLLYPDGSIYYGMLKEFSRHGFGKLLHLNGSYYEGEWFEDMRHGKLGKEYDAGNACYYIGSFHENKKNDLGREYQVSSNQVYIGSYSFDKRNGSGLLHYPNGQVSSTTFRNGNLAGQPELLKTISEGEFKGIVRDIVENNHIYKQTSKNKVNY